MVSWVGGGAAAGLSWRAASLVQVVRDWISQPVSGALWRGPGHAMSRPAVALRDRKGALGVTATMHDAVGIGPRNGPQAIPEVRITAGGRVRSTAPCTTVANCTDDTNHRTDGTHYAGIIRRAIPRTIPRPATAGATQRYHAPGGLRHPERLKRRRARQPACTGQARLPRSGLPGLRPELP